MSAAWYGLETAVNMFDVFFLIALIVKNCDKRKWVKYGHIVAYYIFGVVSLTVLNLFTSFTFISMFWGIFVVVLFSGLYTSGHISRTIFWIIFPYTILLYVDMIVIYSLTAIFGLSIKEAQSQNGFRLILLIIAKLIEIVLLMYFLKRTRKPQNKKIVTPIVIAIFTVTCVCAAQQSEELQGSFITTMTILGMSGIFVTLFHFHNISKPQKSSVELQLLKTKQEYIQLQNRFYDLECEHISLKDKTTLELKASRQSLHSDDKNHHPKNIPKDSEDKAEGSRVKYFHTGNELVNTVLYSKETYALKNHIEICITGNIPKIFHENLDIARIVDHLLSKAIEKVTKVKYDGQVKEIKLDFFEKDRNFYIYIEYYFEEQQSKIEIVLASDLMKSIYAKSTSGYLELERCHTVSVALSLTNISKP